MSNNDDIIGTPEGLGHDPLEWLQDDEDDVSASEGVSDQEERPNNVDAADANKAETAIPEVDCDQGTSAGKPEAMSEPESQPQPSETASDNQSFTFDNHKAILTLPEKLTVQIIEPLHSEWKTLLYDLPQSLEIDASKVKDIDAAGMQLFYALVQQMVFKGSDVVILNVPASLKRHFELFGLDEFFTQFIHAA